MGEVTTNRYSSRWKDIDEYVLYMLEKGEIISV
jgi:hypothetical protein